MGTNAVGNYSGIDQARPLIARLAGWVGRGSLAVLDQGLFAGSNFILNVLLARWLAPNQYGAFAVAFSVFLLLGVFHTAVLTEPMLVFGPAKYRESFQEYLGALLRGHFAVMLPLSLLIAITALVFGWRYSLTVEGTLFSLAVAAPLILLLWLLRRAFYARLKPSWAATGGLVYFVSLLASIVALHSGGHLQPSSGFVAMAAASLVSSALLIIPLHPSLRPDRSVLRAAACDHWRYGKWAAAAAAPGWVSDSIYFLVLPAGIGLAGAGALKAMLNLAMPALHTISALGVLLLPILVGERRSGGMHAMSRTIRLYLFLFCLGCVCYLGLLWGFRAQIFRELYAGKYSGYASWPLLFVGLLPLAQSVQVVIGGALRALERPNLMFWSSAGGAVCAIALGIPLALYFGIGGALLGMVISYALMGFLTVVFLSRSSAWEEV